MSGVWYGVAAYSLWGLLTLYWRLFPHVPAIQVLGHRIVWSFVVLAADRRGVVAAAARVLAFTITPARGRSVCARRRCSSVRTGFSTSSAVNNGFIVESSLGYFITPLVNVLMGVVVFRERSAARCNGSPSRSRSRVCCGSRSRMARCRGSGWRSPRVSAATAW